MRRAREILETSAKAYKNVEALHDTLSYVVNAPGSEQETKAQAYGFGPGRSVFVNALDKTFYLSQSDVPDKYVSASYDRDFGSILRSVAGAGSLFEPPPLAVHETKSLDACVDTFVSIFSNRCASPSEGTFCEDKLHASQDDAPLPC